MKKTAINLTLIVLSVLTAATLLIIADRLIGAITDRAPDRVGILFPPGSEATYSTIEFDFTVRINNLGFRGEDTTFENTRATRILAIGDSFTYGWGVAADETWEAELERRLRARGQDVEVLNLGVPGYSPSQYADTADEAIPLLRPDIVLVELLEGDDLRQTDKFEPTIADGVRRETGSPSLLSRIYPNLIERVARNRTATLSGLNERSASRWMFFNQLWEDQAKAQIAALTDARRAKFRAWPQEIQDAFRAGRLNPSLLTVDLIWAEPDPDEFDIDSDLMQSRIDRTAAALSRIKAAAEAHGARVIVVSIPTLEYNVESDWLKLSGASDSLKRDLLTSTTQRDAAREACAHANLPFIDTTPEFRDLADPKSFYYPLDRHLTPSGQRALGELIASHLPEDLLQD